MQFETINSVYIVDEHRYMRLPKQEGPRAKEPESWRLEDNKWIPLKSWHKEDVYKDGLRLRLFTPDAIYGIITSVIINEKEILPE